MIPFQSSSKPRPDPPYLTPLRRAPPTQRDVLRSDRFYRTLGAARPRDLREVIRGYQACVAATIQQFDGFIARYVGDGVLVYFGWPEARETDAERAVGPVSPSPPRSARIPGRRTAHVRIGIATGLVVIGEPIGSGDSRQQTAVGETPNLAARLQGLAGPDQVVIDAATRRQIGALFECQDLGTVELKGLPAAVSAWQVCPRTAC